MILIEEKVLAAAGPAAAPGVLRRRHGPHPLGSSKLLSAPSSHRPPKIAVHGTGTTWTWSSTFNVATEWSTLVSACTSIGGQPATRPGQAPTERFEACSSVVPRSWVAFADYCDIVKRPQSMYAAVGGGLEHNMPVRPSLLHALFLLCKNVFVPRHIKARVKACTQGSLCYPVQSLGYLVVWESKVLGT